MIAIPGMPIAQTSMPCVLELGVRAEQPVRATSPHDASASNSCGLRPVDIPIAPRRTGFTACQSCRPSSAQLIVSFIVIFLSLLG